MIQSIDKWKAWLALATLVWAGAFTACLQAQPPTAFSGQRAFEDIQHLVAFGPRPPGSQALIESRRWIIRQLEAEGCAVTQDTFTASTPVGAIPMDNLIVKIPGRGASNSSGQPIVMLAGHYDTKLFKNFRFVGANDGGSSAAFLMEMGRDLCRNHSYKFATWLVFFDGEEAIEQEMTQTDGTYGSRHLEQKLAADGDLDRIQAMILVDMIGDKNLDIRRDDNSTGWLNNLLFKAADRLGYARYFLRDQSLAVGDDHTPFIEAGVSAVDIIDFDYGPDNSYWHASGDTLDHCSAASLEIVGRVVGSMMDDLNRSSRIK